VKQTLYTILSVVVWAALLAYVIFAARLCGREKYAIVVDRVEIGIEDEQRVKVITREMVEQWLEEGGFRFEGPVDDVNTEEVRAALAAKPFVRDVRVYTDMRGVVNIDLAQRRPVARFNTADGYNFYFTDDGWVIPIPRGSAMYVPVVTGSFRMPFDRGYFGKMDESLVSEEKNNTADYTFLVNLINFVKLTAEDSFWNAQIVQIVVSQKGEGGRRREPEVEIVPRAGSFVVGLGTLVDVREKLDRLLLFYRNVLPWEGWDNYRYVNLKYRGQVVCTK
jgi:cell division protein FtsQ